jgi:hypothetical protein
MADASDAIAIAREFRGTMHSAGPGALPAPRTAAPAGTPRVVEVATVEDARNLPPEAKQQLYRELGIVPNRSGRRVA